MTLLIDLWFLSFIFLDLAELIHFSMKKLQSMQFYLHVFNYIKQKYYDG